MLVSSQIFYIIKNCVSENVYVSLCICECVLTYVIMCGRESVLFEWTLSGYVFLCSLIIIIFWQERWKRFAAWQI